MLDVYWGVIIGVVFFIVGAGMCWLEFTRKEGEDE